MTSKSIVSERQVACAIKNNTHEYHGRNTHLNSSSPSLVYLFFLFFKIGSLAFGGFMALISVIESTIVNQRSLLKHKDMLDGISLANLLPGPMAVNVVAYVGYRIRGGMGALVATVGVILPSFFLLLVLSYLYFKYGQTPSLKTIFNGLIPAISAIVLSVVWRMGKKTVKGIPELILVLLAAALLVISPLEFKLFTTVAIIGLFGIAGYFWFGNKPHAASQNTGSNPPKPITKSSLIYFAPALVAFTAIWFLPLPFDKNSVAFLMLTFAGMSLLLFGGGYVFIPIIGSIVVLDYGWLTQQEFIDGIALGQVTPGPILISATFIGYKVAGFTGALASTIAMFAPPAILMIIASKAFDYFRHSCGVTAAMRGIHCGVIGMILVAAFFIIKPAFPDGMQDLSLIWPTLLIFFTSLIALLRFNLDVVWILPVAGLLGFLLY